MRHEDALRLMEILYDQDFSDEFIRLVLMYCESGMGIGHALSEAREVVANLL